MRNRMEMDRGAAPGIDWDEIHRRLEATGAALEGGSSRTPEEKMAILRKRAEKIAHPAEEVRDISESVEVVLFNLGSEKYAIEADMVREVCPLRDITPVPCTPPFVLGIMNMRGEIISVIDIKSFFDLPETGLTEESVVIIATSGDMELGILGDALQGTAQIQTEEIQPRLQTLTGAQVDYVKGITEEPVAILDVEKILSDERIIVDEEVET